MKRYRAWFFLVLLVASGTTIVYLGLYLGMRRLSVEYLFVVKGLSYETALLCRSSAARRGLFEGLRFGLFLGAIVGAGTVVGTRPGAAVRLALAAGLFVPAAIAAGSLIGGGTGYAWSRAWKVTVPGRYASQVGRPYRVSTAWGLDQGAAAGGFCGVLAAGSWLFARRKKPVETSKSEADSTDAHAHSSDGADE